MQPPARCSNHRCVYIDQCEYILNKSENATPNLHCLPFIYKTNQMKVYLNVQRLCLHNSKKFNEKTRTPLKCYRGPIFQMYNLNRNLTQFRPSEIQAEELQPSLTAQNGSLNIRQSENVKDLSQKCVLTI